MLFEKINLDNLSQEEISKHKIYIYELDNNNFKKQIYYLKENGSTNLIKKYNEKKNFYLDKLNSEEITYYETGLLKYDIIIGKIINGIFVSFDDYSKRINFFNNIDSFIDWFFEWSGYFSNEAGCSCSWCIDDYIDIYKVKLKLDYLDKQIIINAINEL